jgi:hypothetical protein
VLSTGGTVAAGRVSCGAWVAVGGTLVAVGGGGNVGVGSLVGVASREVIDPHEQARMASARMAVPSTSQNFFFVSMGGSLFSFIEYPNGTRSLSDKRLEKSIETTSWNRAVANCPIHAEKPKNMNHPESKERYLFFGISIKNGLFAGALCPQTIHF